MVRLEVVPGLTAGPIGIAVGLVIVVGATGAALYLKKRMDSSTGIEVVGFALTLMMANVFQLVGVALILSGIFGD